MLNNMSFAIWKQINRALTMPSWCLAPWLCLDRASMCLAWSIGYFECVGPLVDCRPCNNYIRLPTVLLPNKTVVNCPQRMIFVHVFVRFFNVFFWHQHHQVAAVANFSLVGWDDGPLWTLTTSSEGFFNDLRLWPGAESGCYWPSRVSRMHSIRTQVPLRNKRKSWQMAGSFVGTNWKLRCFTNGGIPTSENIPHWTFCFSSEQAH